MNDYSFNDFKLFIDRLVKNSLETDLSLDDSPADLFTNYPVGAILTKLGPNIYYKDSDSVDYVNLSDYDVEYVDLYRYQLNRGLNRAAMWKKTSSGWQFISFASNFNEVREYRNNVSASFYAGVGQSNVGISTTI